MLSTLAELGFVCVIFPGEQELQYGQLHCKGMEGRDWVVVVVAFLCVQGFWENV